MYITKFSKVEWVQRWAGDYTFMTCWYWASQYHFSVKKEFGLSFSTNLHIYREGHVTFYLPAQIFQNFAQTLAKRVIKNPALVKKYCQLYKRNTDSSKHLIKRLMNKTPTLGEFKSFMRYFEKLLVYHQFIKKTVDFLPPKTLDTYLSDFEEARLYAEKFFMNTEILFHSFMHRIGKKEEYDVAHLICLTGDEFEHYLKLRELPPKSILKARFDKSAIYFENGRLVIITGNDVDKIERLVQGTTSKNKQFLGIVAYPGLARGRVRIVIDPLRDNKFNKGDILVTTMTHPDFMPLIKKASAIVAESGGILSHAAITARELKKPCVIGTKLATQILKDGDYVEVDANKGIIKKLG